MTITSSRSSPPTRNAPAIMAPVEPVSVRGDVTVGDAIDSRTGRRRHGGER